MNKNSSYNPQIHHRRSIRLKGYDYSQAGLYFITMCCQDRARLFGEIGRGNHKGLPRRSEMILNDAGKMVESQWLKLPERFKNIVLHEYVIMPDHLHGILEIVGATLGVAPNDENVVAVGVSLVDTPEEDTPEEDTPEKDTPEKDTPIENGQPQGIAPSVGDIMAAFKSITTVEYIRGVKALGWRRFNGKLWQRNYYERIIRDDNAYNNISEYIRNNPAKW
ncbi:MAG: transposase [Bacteroidia bacterium]|nr:transposase [Bacteroidia bacterium]